MTTIDGRSGISGDTRPILEARAAFLATGAYSPVADLADSLVPRDQGVAILDSGCGTGYYLSHLLAERADVAALALDASADAVAMTIAATAGTAGTASGATMARGLVADVWKPLPLRSDVADVILCIFAPRNPGEFARILAPSGRLVVVTPQPDHLRELRERGAVLGIQEDKLEKLDASLTSRFTLTARESLHFEITVDAATGRLLAGMGPAGHHALGGDYAGSVTVAVDASVYLPRAL